MCCALGLVDLGILVSDDPPDYFIGSIATIEDLKVDAEIKAEDPSYCVVVRFDEIGHQPHAGIEIAIAIDESDVACVIRVYGVLFSCLVSGRPPDLYHWFVVIVKDGEYLAPMSGAVVSGLNGKPMRRKVTCIAWAGRFVAVHFEPVDIYTS